MYTLCSLFIKYTFRYAFNTLRRLPQALSVYESNISSENESRRAANTPFLYKHGSWFCWGASEFNRQQRIHHRMKMKSLFVLVLLFIFATACAISDMSAMRQRVTCGSKCFVKGNARKVAEKVCEGKKKFCKVAECMKKKKSGFACVLKETSTVPEFVAPNGTVTFPSATIGAEITFKVNVTVRSGSGAAKEDLYLLSDATGSMDGAIETSKKSFNEVVKARSAVSSDVTFGVGFYRDVGEIPFKNLQTITSNTSKAIAAINKLEATGGGDYQESNLFALSQVATLPEIGWRDGSRKILVYFGDAPGKEPTCPNGVKITREVVIEQLKAKDITVVATSFDGGLDDRTISNTKKDGDGSFSCGKKTSTRGNQARDITAATGGMVVPSNEQTKLIDDIIGSVRTLVQVLTVDTSDCDGKIDVSFLESIPVKIRPGQTITRTETAKILRGACRPGKSFSCDVVFKLSGVPLGTQKITTGKFSSC